MTLKGSHTPSPPDVALVVFHPMFAQKLNELALDVRSYHIGPVFRGKDEVHENANEGLGDGVGGTLSGSNQFLLWDCPWALPTAKSPAPLQGARPRNDNLPASTDEAPDVA
jgi:hypothetical protein